MHGCDYPLSILVEFISLSRDQPTVIFFSTTKNSKLKLFLFSQNKTSYSLEEEGIEAT